MSKYSRDLDPKLSDMVRGLAKEMGISTYVNVDPIAFQSKKEFGSVIKTSEIASLYTGDDTLVSVALNEEVFSRVDVQTQEIWIRDLLNRIEYDIDKDKINIRKPELQVSVATYHKFGNIAVEKAELALITLQQIAEEEEMKKAAAGKKKK